MRLLLLPLLLTALVSTGLASAAPAAEAATPRLTIALTVTGPTTITQGASTSIRTTYRKHGSPVASANLTLQRRTDGRWVDVRGPVAIRKGIGTRGLTPSTSGTFRLRNHDSSAHSRTFTVTVRKPAVSATVSTTNVTAGQSATVTASYTTAGIAPARATLVLQRKSGSAWVDAGSFVAQHGAGTRTVTPTATTTYRVRNHYRSATTAPFTVTVAPPAAPEPVVPPAVPPAAPPAAGGSGGGQTWTTVSRLPDNTLTGVRSGTTLTTSSKTSLSATAQTVEGVRFTGDLVVTGNDLVLRDVVVDGELIVRGSQRVTLEHSTVGAFSISGSTRVTARRLDVRGRSGKDGVHVTSDTGRVADVLIQDSRIHSPAVTATSHYDGIQVRGADRLTLRGNSFELGPHKPQYNAAIFLQEANGGNTAVTIEDNWIDGGGYVLYLAGRHVTLTRNTFGPNGRWGLVFPASDLSSVTFEGNTWGTGAAATL
ncbi:right-handed parallel beta-helix repeat-containing protein [Actinotalea sp. BY-33]|uniref:Right-handed parallel beta-helix repeat-containing protein n=1 Tax=Actinotalea soli TaxID=2819234 RepID=A0A939LQ87_9CELL|nr:right-handed parallel beta-helix repeat-containing protein [Actinotalea soli]MBO1751993.1 right-handed parallel beta-helix repeat-containing protein [Actinotalea soli]